MTFKTLDDADLTIVAAPLVGLLGRRAVAGLPLASLRVFDAAARHLNMGRAAAELGITQGAVSAS